MAQFAPGFREPSSSWVTSVTDAMISMSGASYSIPTLSARPIVPGFNLCPEMGSRPRPQAANAEGSVARHTAQYPYPECWDPEGRTLTRMAPLPPPVPTRPTIRALRRYLRPLRPKIILTRALLLWAAGYILTAVVPARFDRALVGVIARAYLAGHSRHRMELAANMRERLADTGLAAEWDDLAGRHITMGLEEDLGRIRGLHRRGWQPDIEVAGLEHVEAGLEAGKGVLLWRMSSASSPVAKVALAKAGHPLVHLSSPLHGRSRWHGKLWGRYIPRLYATAENRFLKERVVLAKQGNFDYLRVLLDRLGANEVVSIIGDSDEGRQNVEASILGKRVKFASGAPALARRSGCVLLTLYAVRKGPQSYRVIIDPPVELNQGDNRSRFIRDAVQEYARRLESHIVDAPDSWRRWPGGRRGPLA